MAQSRTLITCMLRASPLLATPVFAVKKTCMCNSALSYLFTVSSHFYLWHIQKGWTLKETGRSSFHS